ncbi:MAG: MlaE family ABC transporter permease [Kiritimatiellia bacterium]|nr:ABC transporter permease [Lentisphaerota bacterium]
MKSESPPEVAGERRDDGVFVLNLSGTWRLDRNQPDYNPWRRLKNDPIPSRIVISGRGLEQWDSSLLIFLRGIQQVCPPKVAVELENFPPGAQALLRLARPAAPAPSPAKLSGLIQVWRKFLDDTRYTLEFVGGLTLALGRLLCCRAYFRATDFWAELQECGPAALPIITVISLLVGTILAFMGALQLKLFGAEIFIADLVGIGMVREMGALMTAIIMTGRTGSAFAARLGSMQANEEIDALQTMGIAPMEFLVLPRVLALVLMLPLLTVYANLLGILGGGLVGVVLFDLTPRQYYLQTVNAVTLSAVFSGLIKSVVYGVLIAFSGCLQGLRCGRSASAVGDATTAAVVHGIVYIIVADAILSIVFTLMQF